MKTITQEEAARKGRLLALAVLIVVVLSFVSFHFYATDSPWFFIFGCLDFFAVLATLFASVSWAVEKWG